MGISSLIMRDEQCGTCKVIVNDQWMIELKKALNSQKFNTALIHVELIFFFPDSRETVCYGFLVGQPWVDAGVGSDSSSVMCRLLRKGSEGL